MTLPDHCCRIHINHIGTYTTCCRNEHIENKNEHKHLKTIESNIYYFIIKTLLSWLNSSFVR